MKILILAVGVLIGLVLAADEDTKEMGREMDRYVEMRDIHEQTGGQYGWPAHDKFKERAYQENKND